MRPKPQPLSSKVTLFSWFCLASKQDFGVSLNSSASVCTVTKKSQDHHHPRASEPWRHSGWLGEPVFL